MSQNVIELNGKRYDAITGAYLGKSHVVPKHITERYVQGKVIDGFVRPTRPAPKAVQSQPEPAKKTPAQHSENKPATQHIHAKASHVKAHEPEKAKTLMRRGAKKPETSIKPAIKTQAPADLMTKPQSALAHKRSAYGVDVSRKERAAMVGKHVAVQHFKAPAIHSVSTQAIPVQPAPLPTTPRPIRPAQKPDIFEAAIAHATSHTQPHHKLKRRPSKHRFVNTMAIVAAFLVIGGFIGYLNLPQIELRVASMQAGFGVSMPAYTPTGYALEKGAERSGGTVGLSFRSGDSHFRITQQSSNWNSQTLLDNTLALGGTHETVQKDGQTIYIYEKNGTNAAWVNGGVRYDITGNAQLSKEEITAIATSL